MYFDTYGRLLPVSRFQSSASGHPLSDCIPRTEVHVTVSKKRGMMNELKYQVLLRRRSRDSKESWKIRL